MATATTKEQYLDEIKKLTAARNVEQLAKLTRKAYLTGVLTLQEIETHVKAAK